MSDTDFVINAAPPINSSFSQSKSGAFLRRIVKQWKRSQSVARVPPSRVNHIVTERLHERELFLDEVRGQLRELETSVDELTETIRAMRKF